MDHTDLLVPLSYDRPFLCRMAQVLQKRQNQGPEARIWSSSSNLTQEARQLVNAFSCDLFHETDSPSHSHHLLEQASDVLAADNHDRRHGCCSDPGTLQTCEKLERQSAQPLRRFDAGDGHRLSDLLH